MNPSIPTLNDVAALAGVSKVTVSNVLNGRSNVSEPTRQRVYAAVQQVGYTVNLAARSLAGGQTRTLGFLVPDFSTQYVSELVRGVGETCNELGYDLLISTTVHKGTLAHTRAALLGRQFADGLLVISPDSDADSIRALQGNGVPIVEIDHRGSAPNFPSVGADNYRGARRALEHLLALNHRRIGFVAGRNGLGASADRLRGYREALRQAELPVDPALILGGDFSQPGGFQAAANLLELPDPPTAIFAANDLSAFGAIEAVKDRGLRVPQDVSVVGFDDIPMASQIYPSLTTVRQPLFEMGAAAVRLLLALISGIGAVSNTVTLDTPLVVRHSSARRKEAAM